MAGDGLQLSARAVVSLLARIFGPSFYDLPRFGRGDLGPRGLVDFVSGPHPEPWHLSGPQPDPWRLVVSGGNPVPWRLPPREFRALTLADAHIQEVLALDRIGPLWGARSRNAR